MINDTGRGQVGGGVMEETLQNAKSVHAGKESDEEDGWMENEEEKFMHAGAEGGGGGAGGHHPSESRSPPVV